MPFNKLNTVTCLRKDIVLFSNGSCGGLKASSETTRTDTYAPHTEIYLLFISSISLVEPGPVVTEFERKVYEEGMSMDLSKADKVTADMFTNIYLKNYNQIFSSLGQTSEDIAEVLQWNKCVNIVQIDYRLWHWSYLHIYAEQTW